MYDFYLSLEQQKRSQQDQDAVHEVAHQNLMLSAEGKFDGKCGLPPTKVDCVYWSGYQAGLREYWSQKLGIQLETEF